MAPQSDEQSPGPGNRLWLMPASSVWPPAPVAGARSTIYKDRQDPDSFRDVFVGLEFERELPEQSIMYLN